MAHTLTITFILYSILAAALSPFAAGRNIEEAPLKEKWLNNLNLAEEMNLTKLHFYFHDISVGENRSVYNITEPIDPATWFGLVQVVDHLITAGPEIDSERLGWVQGMHVLSDLQVAALTLNWNFVFNDGSTISVLGRLLGTGTYGELSIVGGTGKYQMARGIAFKRTLVTDPATLNSVMEYYMYFYTSSPVGLMSLL